LVKLAMPLSALAVSVPCSVPLPSLRLAVTDRAVIGAEQVAKCILEPDLGLLHKRKPSSDAPRRLGLNG
jgi:hypothetical protein